MMIIIEPYPTNIFYFSFVIKTLHKVSLASLPLGEVNNAKKNNEVRLCRAACIE